MAFTALSSAVTYWIRPSLRPSEMHWLTYRSGAFGSFPPVSRAAIASAACQAIGMPEAHDIRSGLPFAPIANPASPTAYTSGCETERMVPSTTI